MIRGFRNSFSGFFTHQGFFLAAGLSFYVLMCLVPLLFLIVSLAGFILSSETATRQVINQLMPIIPVYQQELHRALLRIVATRKVSGILGTVILILFSTQLFSATRIVLDRILGVKRGRGYFRGMLFDIFWIFVIGILFLAALAVTDLFAWFKVFVFRPAEMPAEYIRYMSIGLGVTLATAMFYLLYRHLPNRRIPAGAALAGALLASVLWEAAKQLFRFYIVNVGVYDQIYGPLGVLVAFVMFVYYSAIVFILGAEYVGALEHGRFAGR
ncbi:MAG: YihY/virulence factor BrkB family protein [Candidatus Rokubacteria bacterium]|nr:YihY/virulence factor BrkB family protein [Candidatus Rokubacteria bacterium]